MISLVGLYSLASIIDHISFSRSRCHTDLCSAIKILQYPSPAAVFLCRASVALVHDNQIEEVLIKELAVMLLVVITDELLVNRNMDSC